MDSETTHDAHPAFIEIIRQLTPDEARMFAHFAEVGSVEIAKLPSTLPLTEKERFIFFGTGTDTSEQAARAMVDLARDAGCERPERGAAYAVNIERLGLVEQVRVEAPPQRSGASAKAALMLRQYGRIDLRVSAFGRQFANVCLAPRSASAERHA